MAITMQTYHCGDTNVRVSINLSKFCLSKTTLFLILLCYAVIHSYIEISQIKITMVMHLFT